ALHTKTSRGGPGVIQKAKQGGEMKSEKAEKINGGGPFSKISPETVPPPFPPNNNNAPTMIAVRHSAQVDLSGPWVRAIANMIRPAIKNRAPAIKNGGIDWMAKRIPR